MSWISVRNWRRFQHYDPAKRVPPWIKNLNELMADESYLTLSTHRRGVLHGLWMAYASSRCQLPADTSTLSRRLNAKVTTPDLEALNHAGFIDFVASKTLADGYHDASNAASNTLALARSQEAEEKREEAEREDVVRSLSADHLEEAKLATPPTSPNGANAPAPPADRPKGKKPTEYERALHYIERVPELWDMPDELRLELTATRTSQGDKTAPGSHRVFALSDGEVSQLLAHAGRLSRDPDDIPF